MRWKNGLRRLGLGLLSVLLLVAAVAVWHWFRWSGSGKPQRSGEVVLSASEAGLEAPVTVRWDRWAVPMIEAASGRDAAFALGWLHANDRRTQMELGRRAAAGRLSELAGEATLKMDIEARRLRLRRVAEQLWESAGGETKSWLEAYAAGVNAWTDARAAADDLPPGLRLLGRPSEPWHPVDSLGFSVLMARDLSFWAGHPEEARLGWLRAFGWERTWELIGSQASSSPQPETGLFELPPRPLGEGDRGGEGKGDEGTAEDGPLGSNNWILGGSWTASGAPLVANDPHLPMGLPGVWFQVLIRAPDYEVMGMTLPGLPGVVIGRGAHLAWALTNTMLDDQDLFIEVPNKAGTHVKRGEEWAEIEVEETVIRVRGAEPVTVRLRRTDHGVLLDADPERHLPLRSLAWTAFEHGDSIDPLAAFLGLARATSVADARAAVASYVVPAQNLVVTEPGGAMTYVMLGRSPQRRREVPWWRGRVPVPAVAPDFGWEGLAPVMENLVIESPSEDLLITANHDVRPPQWEGELIADFDTSHRADRIRQILTGRRGWTAEDLAAVQADVTSLYALELVELVELVDFDHEGPAAEARALLAAWDGTLAETGPSALFLLFERYLREGVFGDEARHHDLPPFDSRERILGLFQGRLSAEWFDDITTPAVEDRQAIVTAALAAAWSEAHERWGSDPAHWNYGAMHPLTLTHPLGAFPLLGRFYNRGPWPMPGSATTIAAFGGGWRGESPSQKTRPVSFGPSMRWVTDLADGDRTLAVLPGGQSGHPFDEHYDDQLPLFLRGELRPVAWSPAAVEEATQTTLVLNPKPPTEATP
jgi:penicillin amidase